jgi:ABC-type glucose/galactose transport system permease subunit
MKSCKLKDRQHTEQNYSHLAFFILYQIVELMEPFYLNLPNLLSQTAVEISTLRILIAPLISSNSSY